MLFDLLGNDHALLFAFDRARTGHDGEIALAADFHTANLDDRIVGVELAIRLLERLGHAANRFDHAVRFKQIRVNASRIANQTDDGLIRAFDNRRRDAFALDDFTELRHTFFWRSRFDNCDHARNPSIIQRCRSGQPRHQRCCKRVTPL